MLGRIALIIGTGLFAKLVTARWATHGFNLAKALKSIGDDIPILVKQLQEHGETFFEQARDLLDALQELKKGTSTPFCELVAKIDCVQSAYSHLPDSVHTLVDSQFNVQASLTKLSREAAVTEGWRLMGALPDEGDSKENLNQHLARWYRGLYLIGCVQERVSSSDQDTIAHTLRHFHAQLGRSVDQPLVEWYQTVGVSAHVSLDRLLGTCPEIIALGIDHRYIAYAMGQDVDVVFLDMLKRLKCYCAECNTSTT